MKRLIIGLGAALWGVGCADPLEISDYDAGAVVRGTAHLETGEPVVGAAVQVDVYPECGRQPIQISGGGVYTDATGGFGGEFSFLSTGPVVAECIGVRLVDTVTTVILGDSLFSAELRFDARRTDTLEVDLELDAGVPGAAGYRRDSSTSGDGGLR